MAWALVATGVYIKVFLVVCLSIPPLACRQDLCRHTALPPLLVDLLSNLLGNLFLFIVVVEDGAAILRTDVGALAILGRGVVHLVEEFEKRTVLDLSRVIDDLKSLSICSLVSIVVMRTRAR